MVQVGAFVEVAFKRAGQEAHIFLVRFGLVGFFYEPVLLMETE